MQGLALTRGVLEFAERAGIIGGSKNKIFFCAPIDKTGVLSVIYTLFKQPPPGY
jgi:hypothetical protein